MESTRHLYMHSESTQKQKLSWVRVYCYYSFDKLSHFTAFLRKITNPTHHIIYQINPGAIRDCISRCSLRSPYKEYVWRVCVSRQNKRRNIAPMLRESMKEQGSKRKTARRTTEGSTETARGQRKECVPPNHTSHK